MEPSTGVVAAFGAVTIATLLIAHRLLRRLLSGQSQKTVVLGENRASSLAEAGASLALFLVGAGVVKNSVHGESLVHDVTWCAAFGALGLALLELTGFLGQRVLLKRRLSVSLERGNVAAGMAAGGHYVATGVLTARAVAGSDLRGLGLSLAFFVLAQVVHQGLVAGFRMLTSYDDSEQIEGENLAAAISYAGISIAVAIVIGRALEGDFVDWPTALGGFGLTSLPALGFYFLRQLFVQPVLVGGRPTLRGGALDDAIGRDRNVGAATLEALAYSGAALAVAMLA
ncbi:MAG: DUF350 domain-containing protein [Polyangiaceae bacterium]